MFDWKDFKNLRVFRTLRLKQNASIVTENSDGTLSTISVQELEKLNTATRVVNVTASTLAVTLAAHDSKIVTLNRAAGIAVTLPAASGSGARLKFIIGTTITSNSTTIKVANASDTMVGFAIQSQDAGNTLQMFETGATDDTITFNGSTTGGIKGDVVQLEDIAANLWSVMVIGAATGSEATPFSATV